MSLQLPKRAAGGRGTARRVTPLAALGVGVLVLGGCSSETQGEWKRLAMPDPASEQGEHVLNLWQGAWIAALVTGVVVWGLIFYSIWRFRRRSEAEIPVQTRYNLPLEILYTIVPIIMVIVFFAHTVNVQNTILDDDLPVDNTIEVVGQQWSWTFNYGIGEQDASANDDATDAEFPYASYVHEAGTGSYIPTLVLPVGETTRFNLHSPDVIHDLSVPAFLLKMDVVPGRVNHYEITPTRTGEFAGKCFELCGVYHSRMLFNVKVVSVDDYQAYLKQLEDAGATSQAPLLGGEYASTQAGLDSGDQSEEDAQ
ncbi:cytochrome c oxidase subunit II [Nocardioides sp.]|uniref:aa3-type cytochrome oxidase subunit II n=1 Tax=Nocardioides sp. TaxID=35761 RepID=UPI0026261DAA|nr:cytochrome c oxidase subunit II [Nocardioides sp.]MDI6908968.1 cytochrome c oxidase subunit II [Nocardioides sp.]